MTGIWLRMKTGYLVGKIIVTIFRFNSTLETGGQAPIFITIIKVFNIIDNKHDTEL